MPYYLNEAVCHECDINAFISYGGHKLKTLSESITSIPPQIIHIAGRASPCKPAPISPEFRCLVPSQAATEIHYYEEVRREAGWMLPADEEYHEDSAAWAHLRSRKFLRRYLNGPYFDVECLWDEFCVAAFKNYDDREVNARIVPEAEVKFGPGSW